ncbi:MAG: hypothetical protein DRQ45_07025 [Gammaproteobacteria bacterium]|nr:MAG: hypothetical protein DRQ45_07025 [Gammaproteobacteria bacterium]
MFEYLTPACLRKRLPGLLFFLWSIPLLCTAEVQRSANEENGLEKWHFIDGDIEIELVQRLPDQTRALFMNHAFSREVIEQLALSCMFQTIVRNTGKSGAGQEISIDLTQWRMQHAGKTGSILLKEPLLASWSDEDADAAAKLVIRWGMFPTQQEYLPDDYNWGLTAYGIPPGSTFDLAVTWLEGGVQHRGNIKDIVCAPDVDKLK